MTNHTDSSRSIDSDSSAPNSPELTRLSGEQAEERKAREGRLRERVEEFADGFPLGQKDAERRVFLKHQLVDGIMKLAESECSRLASRVEELEDMLRELCIIYEHGYDSNDGFTFDSERAWEKADRVLAGAHAEEKSK